MIFVALLLNFVLFWPINGQSFRSGTISWRPISTDGYNHTVEITTVLTHRESFYKCPRAYILSELVFQWPFIWQIKHNGTRVAWYRYTMVCTEMDKTDNWGLWKGKQIYNISSEKHVFNMTMHLSYWNWNVENDDKNIPVPKVRLLAQNIDFNLRSDTNDFNHSPVANYPSMVFFEMGCPESFTLQVFDEDRDRVTCRYAKTLEECGSVCATYPFFTLNETSCSIFYNGSISGFRDKLVAVALVIEDHPTNNITVGRRNVSTTDYLSAVPYQFLVKVRKLNNGCKKPIALKPSFGTYECITQSEELKGVLSGVPSSKDINFINIFLFGPVGLKREYRSIWPPKKTIDVDIRWKPKEYNIGKHKICFYFRDIIRYPAKFGSVSNVQCFTVEVIADPMCNVSGYDVAPLNGSVSCGCVAPSFTCSYSCHPGYKLRGPESATCPKDSTVWSTNEVPVCKMCDLPAWYGDRNITGIHENQTEILDPSFRLVVKGLGPDSTYQKEKLHTVVLRVIRQHRGGHFRGFVLTVLPGECGPGNFQSLREVEYLPECKAAFQDGDVNLQRLDIVKWLPPDCGCITLSVTVRFLEISDGSIISDAIIPKFKSLTKTVCPEKIWNDAEPFVL